MKLPGLFVQGISGVSSRKRFVWGPKSLSSIRGNAVGGWEGDQWYGFMCVHVSILTQVCGLSHGGLRGGERRSGTPGN